MDPPQEARKLASTPSYLRDMKGMVQLEPLTTDDGPRDILRKMLTTYLDTSAYSSSVLQNLSALEMNARRTQQKSLDQSCVRPCNPGAQQSPIRAIGWGSCGVVYEQLGTTHVLKRAIRGNAALSEECRLSNDLFMHKAVEEALDRYARKGSFAPHFHIPRLYSYMGRNDRLCWSTHAQLFSDGDRTPEDLLLSERIPPIHLVARHAIIDQFCPEELKVGARLQDSNNDCLVRLYLGKRRDHVTRLTPRRFFGLRNFPLCLDQMQDLGLDTAPYAIAFAEALAMMHWEAKIDAADVEFVLGGPPCLTHKTVPSLQTLQQLKATPPADLPMSQSDTGVTHIWLLDFNQCQPITMDEQGVDQAVKRFFDNDPYYPRPAAASSEDQMLWQVFESRYLETGSRLVDQKHEQLPLSFMEKVKQVAQTKADVARLLKDVQESELTKT